MTCGALLSFVEEKERCTDSVRLGVGRGPKPMLGQMGSRGPFRIFFLLLSFSFSVFFV
jgi:hypothetical protein